MAVLKFSFIFNILLFVTFASLIAFLSVVASITLPALVITIYAWFNSSAKEIADFAISVAEPLSLVGAVCLSLLVSCWKNKYLSSIAWSLFTGVSTALGVIIAALWTGDTDTWVFCSLIVIPLITVIFRKIRVA